MLPSPTFDSEGFTSDPVFVVDINYLLTITQYYIISYLRMYFRQDFCQPCHSPIIIPMQKPDPAICFLLSCWTEVLHQTDGCSESVMPQALATVSLFLPFPSNPPHLFLSCQGNHQAKQGHLYSKALSHVFMLSWTTPAVSTITDITDLTGCQSLWP